MLILVNAWYAVNAISIAIIITNSNDAIYFTNTIAISNANTITTAISNNNTY